MYSLKTTNLKNNVKINHTDCSRYVTCNIGPLIKSLKHVIKESNGKSFDSEKSKIIMLSCKCIEF